MSPKIERVEKNSANEATKIMLFFVDCVSLTTVSPIAYPINYANDALGYELFKL